MSQPTTELPIHQQHDTAATIKKEATPLFYKRQQQAFYLHTAVFVVCMIIMFVVNLATNLSAGSTGELRAWWCLWALLGWTIGIIVHGSVVLLNWPSSL